MQFIISELKTGEDHWIMSVALFVMWAIAGILQTENLGV